MPINVNDRVAYAVPFLRSIGAYTGELPFLRGTVVAMHYRGPFDIASVLWDGEKTVSSVNVKNLAKVGLNSRFAG